MVIAMITMDVVHLTIMKIFHNYLIASLLSLTHLHGMKKQIKMCFFVIEFHNLIECNPIKLLKELNWIWIEFNWIWFNLIKFNLIEILVKTLTMLNPKENSIVFSSINFNLWILFNVFEVNSNPIELWWIELHYAKSFHIKIFKWNFIFTKSTYVFHQFIVTCTIQWCGPQVKIDIDIWWTFTKRHLDLGSFFKLMSYLGMFSNFGLITIIMV